MKFKDLKVGQKFRMKGWQPGTVNEKITPEEYTDPVLSITVTLTHREVGTGIGGWHVKPDDDVILVEQQPKPML